MSIVVSCQAVGNSNQKRLPRPSSLSTPTRPPIASIQALVIARPRPVPPLARARDLQSSTRLLEAGAVHAYPETIEASLRLSGTALRMLDVATEEVDEAIQGVRDWGYRPVAPPEATGDGKAPG